LKDRCRSILDVEPLHIVPLFKWDSLLFVVLPVFIRKLETLQTVKLTLNHRAETLRARYEEVDPSNEPNRPHISSVSINVKKRRDKT
ncbi:MAG: hypothetical protein ABJH45_01450, partial [Paracoccaceae bacterium]